MGKVLWSERLCLLIMRFAFEAGDLLPYKGKWSNFLTRVFLITSSSNVGISWVKWDYPVLWTILSTFKFVFFTIQNMLIWFFHFFREVFKFWVQYFQLLCMPALLLPLCITICTTVRKIFVISLVVKLLIYSKIYFLI